jgi:hypothetical protein
MSPLEAAQTAHQIATREGLPLARIAELEVGAAGAVTWFAANIMRFFEAEAAAVVDTLTNAQFRRYIAWMRFNR